MAWAVPFARSVVIHFQHDYFLYWIVSPKRCRIDNDEGTFLLVYKMYHQCDTKLFTSMVHYCSLLKCITKEKKLAKLWNFVFFLELRLWTKDNWHLHCLTLYHNVSPVWYSIFYEQGDLSLFTKTYHRKQWNGRKLKSFYQETSIWSRG